MTNKTEISRRSFMKSVAVGAGAASVPATLTGCFEKDDKKDKTKVPNLFGHGIASGDPLADRVIIWTRATPVLTSTQKEENIAVQVDWQVARDIAMSDVVASGSVVTDANVDFTVKVDVEGLVSDTQYFYQFTSSDKTKSVVGKTKTLPVNNVTSVKFAVCSCANYPAGFFNVYDAIAKTDADVVLHLGDYIYEYQAGKYPLQAVGSRNPDPAKELLSLADYRQRYAQYHSDEQLQLAHQEKPFICIWDDHEVANDSYKDGAENHNEGEGVYAERKAAAIQAYHEWLPIRTGANQAEIYRHFEFGDLVSLNMLDTRLLARDKPLSITDFIVDGVIEKDKFKAALTDPSRQMLGTSQHQWVADQFSDSNATWEVLGQQVLMGRMLIPAELLTKLGALQAMIEAKGQLTAATIAYADNPDALAAAKAKINKALEALGNDPAPVTVDNLDTFITGAQASIKGVLGELATIKTKQLNNVAITAAEKTRLETVAPYNLDAWDGYFLSRENLMLLARIYDKNLISLAGDTHNAWGSDLKLIDLATGNTAENGEVGVEFATSSVSSPGFDEYLTFDASNPVVQFEGAVKLLVDDLQSFNASQRGFMTVTFTKEKAVNEWFFVDTIQSRTYTLSDGDKKHVKPGKGNRQLVDGI